MDYLAALGWSPSTALRPCLAISGAFAYSLYTLSTPHHYSLGNVAVISLLAAVYFQHFNDLYPDDQLNASFAHGVLMWLVHIVHVVLLRGDAVYIAGRSTQSGELPEESWTAVSAPGLSPYHRAYKMLYNFRGIGTSWQVVKTPDQPPRDEATTGRQSRGRFLLGQVFPIFCHYIGLALFFEISESGMLVGPGGNLFGDGSDYFSSLTRDPRSARLSVQEVAIRTQLTMNFIFHNWLLYSSLHKCLSILFVCVLRLDEPYEWPPLYGNILEAYTVRRFWAYFWHRLVYAPFRAVADTLSARVWGRKNRGAARRFVNVTVVFLLSGFLHSIMDWEKGWCNFWASGIFYSVQPLGFILESLVQFAWAPLRERVFGPRSRAQLSAFERTLGYLWVTTWFFWLYPQRIVLEVQCRAET